MMKHQQLNLPDAQISYFEKVFDEKESASYFNELLNDIRWRQDTIKLFGKTHLQPRLTALYANNELPYSYSNITMTPWPFTPTLLDIKKRIEAISEHQFTSCLLNLYRDGSDSNGWHADDEKELGPNPVIASVSFGAERIFQLKHKTLKDLKHNLILHNGSLLLMQGATQHHWMHQLPKTKKPIGKRINLTFRIIK